MLSSWPHKQNLQLYNISYIFFETQLSDYSGSPKSHRQNHINIKNLLPITAFCCLNAHPSDGLFEYVQKNNAKIIQEALREYKESHSQESKLLNPLQCYVSYDFFTRVIVIILEEFVILR